MTDILKLTCPSCGSKLSASDETNLFTCASCGNSYLFRQSGSSITLVPAVDGKAEVVGDHNVIVRVNNVLPGAPGHKPGIEGPEPTGIETGECPICGRLVPRTGAFRCKNCQRTFICLTHQDKDTFLCSDCRKEQLGEYITKEHQHSRWGLILSSIVISLASLFACFLTWAMAIEWEFEVAFLAMVGGTFLAIAALLIGNKLRSYRKKFGVVPVIIFWISIASNSASFLLLISEWFG